MKKIKNNILSIIFATVLAAVLIFGTYLNRSKDHKNKEIMTEIQAHADHVQDSLISRLQVTILQNRELFSQIRTAGEDSAKMKKKLNRLLKTLHIYSADLDSIKLSLFETRKNVSMGQEFCAQLKIAGDKIDSLTGVIKERNKMVSLLYETISETEMKLKYCTEENKSLNFVRVQNENRISEYNNYINLPFYKKIFTKKKKYLHEQTN